MPSHCFILGMEPSGVETIAKARVSQIESGRTNGSFGAIRPVCTEDPGEATGGEGSEFGTITLAQRFGKRVGMGLAE